MICLHFATIWIDFSKMHADSFSNLATQAVSSYMHIRYSYMLYVYMIYCSFVSSVNCWSSAYIHLLWEVHSALEYLHAIIYIKGIRSNMHTHGECIIYIQWCNYMHSLYLFFIQRFNMKLKPILNMCIKEAKTCDSDFIASYIMYLTTLYMC